jgi:hypothetical protein
VNQDKDFASEDVFNGSRDFRFLELMLRANTECQALNPKKASKSQIRGVG